MLRLDMTAKPCPIPVIETKKAIRAAQTGDKIEVIVDNDIARQNLEKLAKGLGHNFLFSSLDKRRIEVVIEIKAANLEMVAQPAKAGLTVAIGRDRMGDGDDSLGRALMKSFIYSLTALEPAPEFILFFNSGVTLACAGSNALDDLAALEKKGVGIASCGACLNFFSLTDKLKAGSITNMDAILGAMAQAKRLINL